MIKVAVIGSAGLVGSSLVRDFSTDPNFSITATYNNFIPDFTRPLELLRVNCFDVNDNVLFNLFYQNDFVINCAMQRVGPHADFGDFEKTLYVNSLFPKKLDFWSERVNRAKHINISTDAVYSGKSVTEPYSENDQPNPIDLYGYTKYLGEMAGPNTLNIRTSFVGNDVNYRRGLFEWIASLKFGETVVGYNNYIWSGVTTLQFSKFIVALMRGDFFSQIRDYGHVLNYTCNPPITKYELINLIIEAIGREDINVVAGSSPFGIVDRRLQTSISIVSSFNKRQDLLKDSIKKLAIERLI